MALKSQRLEAWVRSVADLAKPDSVVWCDGSATEYEGLVRTMIDAGTVTPLNETTHPNCVLHRSDRRDVARVEQFTFSCLESRDDVGPTNNWMSPSQGRQRVEPLLAGAMQGRTMYVVPYVMGPVGSPWSRVGVEVTDSAYVAANMRIMTRMGQVALDQLGSGDEFVTGLHSLGDLSPDRRYILHFLDENLIWSVGSGYGGNALLGKKCHALRIAGWQARREGWMAEHMLILGLEDPSGQTTYMAAAFPSACGKTNLAMLVSPLAEAGYKVTCVGDDIAWMHVGQDGQLWAINPEAGFFGVAPGTSGKTNPNAMATIGANTIYTNVAMTADRRPWWEGGDESHPAEGLTDWLGRQHFPGSEEPAAHPNSRFTAPAHQCPSISPHWQDPRGVPISALIFGGRRARLAPLVYQARDWVGGVFAGATMASEITSAAVSDHLGQVRRDPMAMLPFCAYNMADYFAHWLAMGRRLTRPPAIFHVNWFRKDTDGRFLWPGFGQNIRVLMWILGRVRGQAPATETPIGLVPAASALNLEGLELSSHAMEELLAVKPDEWRQALPGKREHLERFGERLPRELLTELANLERRLSTVTG